VRRVKLTLILSMGMAVKHSNGCVVALLHELKRAIQSQEFQSSSQRFTLYLLGIMSSLNIIEQKNHRRQLPLNLLL
jgi:hypothetical protein